MTTVYNYIRIGAFLPINPSPTTLCVCHSGFLIVSEYFPDDWCIKQSKTIHALDLTNVKVRGLETLKLESTMDELSKFFQILL